MNDLPQATAESPDILAIHSLLDRLRETWAAGDAVGYAHCFLRDCDYVTYNGMHLRGRQENAGPHAALFRGPLRGTRISARMESLEFLSANVALIFTSGSGARRGRTRAPRRQSIQTLIAVKEDHEWRIRYFQNARVRRFGIWLTRMITSRRS